MRICALRGENLASLVGRFEIDFEKPPLASAGLFAITGATAAGKSTLLDAICLALYDAVPRLRWAPGHVVGKEGIKANDVRSLFSQGAASGFSEVEFIGCDGVRYVARWDVRRAFGKASGPIQKQTMSLVEKGGQPKGGTKTETLEAIEKAVGLNFDQFCRSALLAQGDFAAFLKAKAADRAALLEKMTGTEIYTKLSKAAQKRASEEKAKLAAVTLQEAAVKVLPPEERARLEEARASKAATVATAKGAVDTAEAAIRWHVARSECVGLVEAAAADLAAKDQSVQAAASRGSALEATEKAQPLRAKRDAVLSVASELTRAEQDHRAAAATHATAKGNAADLEQKLAEASKKAHAAEAALVAAKPRLEEAQKLDYELAASRKTLMTLQSTHASKASSSKDADSAAEKKAGEANAATSARDDASKWLAKHAAEELLSREWTRWKKELERAAAAHSEVARLEKANAALEKQLSETTTTRDAAATEERSARARLEAQSSVVAEAKNRVEEATLHTAPGRHAALVAERARLDELGRVASSTLSLTKDIFEQKERGETALARAEKSRADAAAARANRVVLEARRAENESALLRVRSARDLESRRHELVAGEPCPLCGALEHPYATKVPPLDELLVDFERGSKQLMAEIGRERDAETAAVASVTVQTEAAEDSNSQVTRLSAKLAEERTRWQALGPSMPLDAHAVPALAALAGAKENEIVAAARAEEELVRFTKEAAAAQNKLEKHRTEYADAERSRVKLEQDVETKKVQLDADRSKEASARGEEATSLADLRPAFSTEPDFTVRLFKGAKEFVADSAQRADAFLAKERARAEAALRVVALAPELEAVRTRAAELATEAKRAASEAKAAEQAHSELATRRADLFDGRGTAVVQSELEGLVRAAREAAEAALTKHGDAVQLLAAAAAKLEAISSMHEERRTACHAAQAVLAAALSELGCMREELDARLEHDEAWIRACREELTALARAVSDATSVLAERRARLEKHEQTGKPAHDVEQARAALERAQGDLTAAQSALDEKTLAVLADDKAKETLAGLKGEAEQLHAKAKPWLALNDLIGHSDGTTFRVFAQGLTFEVLLEQANEHLKLLRPRYRLGRVPGDDLELQVVDLEQGNEARSASGLSGGETFLVSLALALGLASLTSKDTRVESLFIDEGFGTLDPATLAEAIDALEALQASGRKVGVISHVNGLAEQIGVQIQVTKLGGGRSRVRVLGAAEVVAEVPAAPVKKKRRAKVPTANAVKELIEP